MSVRSAIVGQFKRPHGALGHLAGLVMASRRSNRERNAWTVELLQLEPHHAVLEIGCGPGLALAACAARVDTGRAVGIDHSRAMVAQARHRLAREIGGGRAEVRVASLAEALTEPAAYDRVFSLNVVQFLPDIEEAFRQMRACLAEGGMAATTFQPRSSRPAREQALGMADRIERAMRAAGFAGIERHELPLEPAPAVCVTGLRSPTQSPDESLLARLLSPSPPSARAPASSPARPCRSGDRP